MSMKLPESKGSVSFGARLREERERMGLSQLGAAESCGVSREMWGRYERDAGNPGADVLARMASAGIDTQYIVTGDRTPGPAHITATHHQHESGFEARIAALRNATAQAMALDLSGDYLGLVRDILFAIALRDADLMRTVVDTYVERHTRSKS